MQPLRRSREQDIITGDHRCEAEQNIDLHLAQHPLVDRDDDTRVSRRSSTCTSVSLCGIAGL